MPPKRGDDGASGSRGGGGGSGGGGTSHPFTIIVNGYEVPALCLPRQRPEDGNDNNNDNNGEQRRVIVQRRPAERACRHLAIQLTLDADDDDDGDGAGGDANANASEATRIATMQDLANPDGAVAVHRFRNDFGARLGPAPAIAGGGCAGTGAASATVTRTTTMRWMRSDGKFHDEKMAVTEELIAERAEAFLRAAPDDGTVTSHLVSAHTPFTTRRRVQF